MSDDMSEFIQRTYEHIGVWELQNIFYVLAELCEKLFIIKSRFKTSIEFIFEGIRILHNLKHCGQYSQQCRMLGVCSYIHI